VETAWVVQTAIPRTTLHVDLHKAVVSVLGGALE
jgi:hypothetical protein